MKKSSKKIILFSMLGFAATGAILGGTLPLAFKTNAAKNNVTSFESSNNNVSSKTTIGQNDGDNVFSEGTTSGQTEMSMVLHSSRNTILKTSDSNSVNLSAVISGDDSVTLTTSLDAGKNNTLGINDITYQWYYTTTAPSDNEVMSASLGTPISNQTSASLDVTSSTFPSEAHVLYFFAIISFKVSGSTSTATAPSGVYAVSNNGINLNQTINDVSGSTIGLISGQTATLGLNVANNTNNEFTIKSYSWGSSTTNSTSDLTWNSNNSNSYTANYASGLTYYFATVIYDYNGCEFAYTTPAFMVDGVSSNITVDGKSVSLQNLADFDNDEATLAINMPTSQGTVESVKWYDSSTQTAINPQTAASVNNTETWTVTNNILPSNAGEEKFISAYVTYRVGNTVFDVLLTPILLINITANISSQTNNTNSNSNSNSTNSSKDNSTNSDSNKTTSTTNSTSNSQKTTSSSTSDSTKTTSTTKKSTSVPTIVNEPTLTSTQTVTNGNGVNGVNLMSGQTSTLTDTVKLATGITNETYNWYYSSSDTFDANTATILNNASDSLTLSASNLKGVVNYYFMVMDYTYENHTFQYVSSVFVVTNINASISYTKEWDQSSWTKGAYDVMLFDANISTSLPSWLDVSYSHNNFDSVISGNGNTNNGSSFYIEGVWGQTYTPTFTISYTIDNINISFQISNSFKAEGHLF